MRDDGTDAIEMGRLSGSGWWNLGDGAGEESVCLGRVLGGVVLVLAFAVS